MEPLIVLVAVFVLSFLISRVASKKWNPVLSGNIAMSIMLFFTAISHFIFTEGMALMLPEFISFKTGMVYFTGIVEVAAATGLLISRTRYITGIWLLIFFLLILPANIYEAIEHVDLRTATYTGSGPDYLWFRVPLQLLFIVWVWYFSIRRGNNMRVVLQRV